MMILTQDMSPISDGDAQSGKEKGCFELVEAIGYERVFVGYYELDIHRKVRESC